MDRVLLLVTGALVCLGCTRSLPEGKATKEPEREAAGPTSPAAAVSVAPTAGEIDERFVADVKAVFASYKPWGRVDDELRWAPWLCRLPEPGRPAMSAAGPGAGGHGKKLYSLFAKDRKAYAELYDAPTKMPAVGQALAKESFIPEFVKEKVDLPRAAQVGDVVDHFDPYVQEGDTLYRATTLAGVYVMLRKDPATPGTDDGWVYGTVTASGELTSAGRVASCMGCHASAKHGRLFGRSHAMP